MSEMRTNPAAPPERIPISYVALIPYVLVHLVCFGVLWTGMSRTGFFVFLSCFGIRMFALSVGYHRYFAHRAFKTSRPVQLVLALLGTICLQGGVLWWAETHRRHHRNADTPDDLHSPHYQGFFYSHFGWFIDKRNRGTKHDRIRDLARFPELVWLDRYHILPFVLFAVAIFLGFGAEGLLWGVFIPTVMMWEITHWVQSFSHAWGGYRRWDSPDQSRNHWLLGVLALGEYHNNHHRFPSSPRQGHVWWEIDLGYYVLSGLSALGIVWDLKIPPELSRQNVHQHDGKDD